MKINKPYNISSSQLLGKTSSKHGRDFGVESSKGPQTGVTLSGSASFIQTMREAVESSEVRPDVVAQAKEDIANQDLGSESDYNQSVTALLVEL